MPPSAAVRASFALATAAGIGWWCADGGTPRAETPAAGPSAFARRASAVHGFPPSPGPTPGPDARPSRTCAGALAPEKAARVAAILKDYEALRATASAEHEALGEHFPGGLTAFLRQLGLLDREQRLDLAAVLTPPELEDYELRESPAGHTVQELLDDSAARPDQLRAVFLLQREFDDRFALSFEASPSAALERERARIALQENIHGALGPALFAAWLRGEGADYGRFALVAIRHQLPDTTALDLWRIKNDYTLSRLELGARSDPPTDASAAHRELVAATLARVHALVGGAVVAKTGPEWLGWLPQP